jgi:hypothetical protein
MSGERGEEQLVVLLERLLATLATAPHLTQLLPPIARTTALLAGSTSSDVEDFNATTGGTSERVRT